MRLQEFMGMLSFLFVELCSATGIPCTVTQVVGGTLYIVPECNVDDCHYQWLNMSKHVIANQGPRTEPVVVRKDNRSLVTNKCSKRMYFILDCMSEGIQLNATCTTNCSGNSEAEKSGEFPHTYWIVPAVIVLVLGLLGLLCYRCRHRILR